MKPQKMIISMLLACSIMTTNVYPIFGCLWPKKESLSAKVFKTFTSPKRFGRFVKRVWKKTDKMLPAAVSGAILAALIYAFIKKPAYAAAEEGAKKIIHYFPKSVQKYLLDDKDIEKDYYKTREPKIDLEKDIAGKLPSQIVRMLKILKKNKKLPKKPLLFHGPSGTGKTTVAEGLAKEFGKISGKRILVMKAAGSDFLDKYVGETPKKIKRILVKAEKNARNLTKLEKIQIKNLYLGIFRKTRRWIFSWMPYIGKNFQDTVCVVIIDELYSMTTGRTTGDHGYAAVEALQTAIDEYVNENPNLIVIATTNYPKKMPKPTINRFKRILFDKPSIEDMGKILKLHTSKAFKEEHGKEAPYKNITREKFLDNLIKEAGYARYGDLQALEEEDEFFTTIAAKIELAYRRLCGQLTQVLKRSLSDKDLRDIELNNRDLKEIAKYAVDETLLDEEDNAEENNENNQEKTPEMKHFERAIKAKMQETIDEFTAEDGGKARIMHEEDILDRYIRKNYPDFDPDTFFDNSEDEDEDSDDYGNYDEDNNCDNNYIGNYDDTYHRNYHFNNYNRLIDRDIDSYSNYNSDSDSDFDEEFGPIQMQLHKNKQQRTSELELEKYPLEQEKRSYKMLDE